MSEDMVVVACKVKKGIKLNDRAIRNVVQWHVAYCFVQEVGLDTNMTRERCQKIGSGSGRGWGAGMLVGSGRAWGYERDQTTGEGSSSKQDQMESYALVNNSLFASIPRTQNGSLK